MFGIPSQEVMAIVRLRQWAFERQALKAAKTTDYRRHGWKHRKSEWMFGAGPRRLLVRVRVYSASRPDRYSRT